MALNIGKYVSNLWGGIKDRAAQDAARDQAQKTTALVRDLNTALAEQEMPAGAIVMFDDRDTCPTGWTLVTAFVGRFPRGVSSGAGTNGGNDSHSHTAGSLSAADSAFSDPTFFDGAGSPQAVAHPDHTHPITGSTASADNIPAFRQVIFCKKD